MIKPDPTPPEAEEPSRASSLRSRWTPLIPLVGGILLLLIAVVVIIVLVLTRLFPGREAAPGMRVRVVKPTPTPFTSPLTPTVSCEPPVISSDDVEVAASLPISLTVAGESFPIVTTTPDPEGWSYPADSSGAAAWICGLVVNYVVGLEPTAENQDLLTNLRPGDEIKLHLSNGTVFFFRFIERRETEANDPSVFAQTQPRLTLILEKEEGAWQVAVANYATETEPVESASGQLAQPGEPMRIGEIEVTVVRGHYERGYPDLAPGTMYYMVEFTIQNTGATSLNPELFNMRLQDNVGSVYLPSPAASALGEYGLLDEQIPPGSTVEGTAGYLAPETLAGPTLIWTFRPWPDSELRASTIIPYEELDTEPDSAGRAVVSITDAFLDEDLLIIEGEVRNAGEGSITIEQEDISLSSSAGLSELLGAAPTLPWTIEPGQTQIIELQYEKPSASAAVLSLAGYSFDIGGIQ